MAAPDWRRLVVVFWLTSAIEAAGISQVYALLPQLLSTMGITGPDRLTFIGLFGALLFLLGLPLVPLWGVWADRYSRKAVIVRSAIVAAVVFAGLALAREPWQVGASMLLIGLQLGNTGVMLAAIRDTSPRHRIGTIIAVFGTSGPIGFAVGPVLAGLLIDQAHWTIHGVFWLDAGLSMATALLVSFGAREVRPEVVPQGRMVTMAFGALRSVLADGAVRRVFVVLGAAFLANQLTRAYVPVLVENVHSPGPGLASAIGLVSGTSALAGALLAPPAGALGDRVGFRRVLVVALLLGGLGLGAMPLLGPPGGVGLLTGLAVLAGASFAITSSSGFSLLAIEVEPARRSQTLNLVYLPLYAAGVIGPATGAVVARFGGVDAPFLVGGAALLLGAVAVTRLPARRPAIEPVAGVAGIADPEL